MIIKEAGNCQRKSLEGGSAIIYGILFFALILFIVFLNLPKFNKSRLSTFLPRIGGTSPSPNNQSGQTGTLSFHLYTRVTNITWPQIEPYAKPGDLFWGQVDSIPASMRALTFPDYSALTTRLSDSVANQYSAISLDGEYKDFAQAFSEAKQIRAFIDNFNNKHKNDSGFSRIKFIAFYHLDIIDAYPDIVKYPDEVIVGKTTWDSTNMLSVAAPYVNKIQAAGKVAVVLLSNKTTDKATKTKHQVSGQAVVTDFLSVLDSKPSGLGLNTVSFYYDTDQDAQLLYALQTLRGK